jgi:hypothetical protein
MHSLNCYLREITLDERYSLTIIYHFYFNLSQVLHSLYTLAEEEEPGNWDDKDWRHCCK